MVTQIYFPKDQTVADLIGQSVIPIYSYYRFVRRFASFKIILQSATPHVPTSGKPLGAYWPNFGGHTVIATSQPKMVASLSYTLYERPIGLHEWYCMEGGISQ